MKKVIALVGSARHKHTYNAVRQFLTHLQARGAVEGEIITLSDYQLEVCRGCKVCFAQGEEFCPLTDDRDLLLAQISAADGLVFASPNYAFQVAAQLKILLERLAFILHRPRFFGKTSTSIVTQGVYGGDKIVRYLDFVGTGMGFHTIKGQCFTAFEPLTEREAHEQDRRLARQSQQFYTHLMQPTYPAPSWFQLLAFRMGRTSMRLELDDTSYDYRYYRDQGWFTADYYYPVRLGVVKKVGGRIFDLLATRMARNR